MNLDRPRRRVPTSLRRLVLVLLFFLVVHYLVLPQLVGARSSLAVISHLNPLLVVAGVGAEVASLMAYTQLTRTLIPGVDRPGFRAVLHAQLATLGASHVVPGGTAAVTPLGFRLLRRAGVSASDASFVIGAQTVGSAAVLNALLWLALVVSIPIRGGDPTYLGIAIVGTVVIGGFGALVVGMSRGSKAADWFVRVIAHRVHFIDAEAASVFLHDLVDRFHHLASNRHLMARAAGLATFQWLADAASLWIFLAALGVKTPPDALLIAFGLANISAAIPFTPGGLGLYEAVITSSLVGFGVPRAEAIIGVLAYRFFEFWMPIPLGIAAYFSADTSLPAETPTDGTADMTATRS